jgi:DNA-binding GntR family transcriptional regulator
MSSDPVDCPSTDTLLNPKEMVMASAANSAAPTLRTAEGKAAGFYELIRAAIVSGRLAPGERLSEASLGREYGASRSPIREALASLDRDGLVERHGLTVRVRERTPGEVLDIYQLRIHLEGAIANDAALRRQPLDLGRLDAALTLCDEVDTGDATALMEANKVFHGVLSAAAHNATLSDVQDRLTAQIAVLPATTLSVNGRWEEAQDEHRRIAEAVRAGDAETARAVAEQHMKTARDIRLRLYESNLSF